MHLVITIFLLPAIVFGHIPTVQGACSSKLGNSNIENGQHRGKIPAFAAFLTKQKTLGSSEVVKFNKVWTNLMNGYDPNTGIFTAPKEGVYQFSCTVMTQHEKTVRIHMLKNNMKTVAVYPGNKGYNMGTLNIVLGLQKSDHVYIKQGHGEKDIYSESTSNYSMFSGYLIAQIQHVATAYYLL